MNEATRIRAARFDRWTLRGLDNSGYLSRYVSSVDPTTAYHLNLTDAQNQKLFESLKADWALRRILVNVGPEYDELNNNCAQYACGKIVSATSDWNSIRGVLSEVITVESPVLFTNGALRVLRLLGIPGGIEKDLRPPSKAPQNVVVYWTTYPSAK